jgi:Flp pilus assembly protein TadG
MKGRNRQRGNAVIEFTLVGIPLIFVLISVFEMARGMWIYHTLAYAIKEGTRYAIVHGSNCGISPNACQVTIGQIAQRIADAGVGLIPGDLSVTFSSTTRATTTCPTLSGCFSDSTTWPQYPDNQPGLAIGITGTYPFQSALAMFWPGAGSGVSFGNVAFPATSQETIQY